jgi:hypothetical protein
MQVNLMLDLFTNDSFIAFKDLKQILYFIL